jgi:hypothetical protein
MGLGALMDLTGWGQEALSKALEELTKEGMVTYDEYGRSILLRKAVARCQCQSPNVAKAWGRHLASMPSSRILTTRTNELRELLSKKGKAYIEAFREGLGEAFPKVLEESKEEGIQEGSKKAMLESDADAIPYPNTYPNPYPSPRPPTPLPGSASEPHPEETIEKRGEAIQTGLEGVKEPETRKNPQPEQEGLETYLVATFEADGKTLSPHQRKSLLDRGLTYQDAYRCAAVWEKILRASRLKNPVAYAWTLLDTAVQDRSGDTSE